MRYTIAFAKRMDARFLSHLEMARAFERALRRAEIPLSLSHGYNPHAYLSFALPLGVGVASRCEYLEVELARPLPCEEIGRRLQAELPLGLKVKVVTPSAEAGALPSLVKAGAYLAQLHWLPAPDETSVRRAVASLLAKEEIRVGDKGKDKNIRPGIWRLRPRISDGRLYLSMLLAAGSRRHVRPEWVTSAICRMGNWQEEKPALFWRLGLFACQGDGMVPLGLWKRPEG